MTKQPRKLKLRFLWSSVSAFVIPFAVLDAVHANSLASAFFAGACFLLSISNFIYVPVFEGLRWQRNESLWPGAEPVAMVVILFALLLVFCSTALRFLPYS